MNKIREGLSFLNKKLVPPQVALLEMISGMWVAKSIGVVAALGIADIMDDGYNDIKEVAKKAKCNPDALYRVLRALSTVGIFSESPEKKFALTPVGMCLRKDHPQSMRSMAMFQTEINWKNWAELRYSVETGNCAAEKALGMKPFDYLAKNPKDAEVFDNAMVNISKMEVETILAAFDFSRFKTIADIGGGYGFFLSSILSVNPSSDGILFDMPHVIEDAKLFLKKNEMEKRIKTFSGSFFETIPEGADAYVMKHIIHDWSDAESNKILKNIHKVMKSSARLIVIEPVIPNPNVADFSKFLDLEMLVVTTGKERTREEFEQLFHDAGFKLLNICPTASMANVIECEKLN